MISTLWTLPLLATVLCGPSAEDGGAKTPPGAVKNAAKEPPTPAGSAQDPSLDPTQDPSTNSGALPAGQEDPADDAIKSDPFQPDEALRALLGRGPQDAGFQPLLNRPALPKMSLKGLLRMAGNGKAAAAVEVEGVGTYVVREGGRIRFSIAGAASRAPGPSDVSTNPGDPARTLVQSQIPIVLQVDEVSTEGVVVRVGTLGETLVIR